MAHVWLFVSKNDLDIERQQCLDEGKDLGKLEAQFAELTPALVAAPDGFDLALSDKAGRLLDKTALLKVRKDFPFVEPSRLPDIRAQRGQPVPLPTASPKPDVLLEKAYGAWAGRCCGCMLGKPVEGRRRQEMELYLKAQDRWPLDYYWSGQVSDDVRKTAHFPDSFTADNPTSCEKLDHMFEDDDTNYTATGLGIIKRFGPNFSPANVGDFWASEIPLLHTCTAERVAYRNFALSLPAVDKEGNVSGKYSTATYRNVYREWIGAQIRADFFGYVNPANPERAAEFAWRDAAFSHVRNGIYGEMWVAAMLAAAYVCDDVETVIRAGLAQVPARSRFVRDIEEVFAWRRAGKTYEQAVEAIHARWDQTNGHHWCHTNSNAQIVALALLWGNKDFEKTICGAVMPGFDTDCNGATAGSVLGMLLGRSALPAKWTGPINDTLHTGVTGYHIVKLADMARETVDMMTKVNREYKP